MSSAPTFEAPCLNWTPATATLSAAEAVTETTPDTEAPLAGAVMETVGGVVSGVAGVAKVALPDVARLPAASRDFTRML